MHCVCVWDRPSVEAVRAFVEPTLREVSRDRYHEVENRGGVHVPARFAATAQHI
jgi:hypothetical protein